MAAAARETALVMLDDADRLRAEAALAPSAPAARRLRAEAVHLVASARRLLRLAAEHDDLDAGARA